MTLRVSPWIALLALASCNSIFGLDDDSTFLPPDSPTLNNEPRVCLEDTFDVLKPEWEPFDLATVFAVEVKDGELQMSLGGQTDRRFDGLRAVGTYNLDGGSVVARVSKLTSASSGVDVGIDIRAGERVFRMSTRQGFLGDWYIAGPGQEEFSAAIVSDTIVRLRHDEIGDVIVYESAAAVDGDFTVRKTQDAPSMAAVTISITGWIPGNADGTVDLVGFDDFTLTARCP